MWRRPFNIAVWTEINKFFWKEIRGNKSNNDKIIKIADYYNLKAAMVLSFSQVLVGCYLDSLAELARKSIQLDIMSQITKCITIEMSFDEMMENVAKTLREVIDYDLLSFCIIESQKRLVIKTSVPKNITGLEEGALLKGVNSKRSVSWLAIRQKRFFIREDLSDQFFSFAEDKALLQFGIQSVLIVPLIVKNRVTGTFNLGSRKKGYYSESDANFLQQVADHLAVCFENARLYSEESKIKTEWEDTFKAVTDIMYLIDKNFNMVRFNKAAYDFGRNIGVRPEVGKECFRYFGEHGEKCENCSAKEVFQTGKTSFKRSYFRFGQIWDGWAYPIFNSEEKIDRVILVVKNVTKKVQIETQLIQSAKLADIGIITAGIAHELNSPLTAIIGDSLLLEQEGNQFNDDQIELLTDIKKCGIRCKDIINTVRDFARKDKFSFQPTNMNEVVSEALKLVSYLIEKNKIRLVAKLTDSPKTVMASSQHLVQLLVNLLVNARDAVNNISDPLISICTGYSAEERMVTVMVKDNGCGMHQEEIINIFNAFYTTKPVSEGTGLGLSISKRIAEEHGGRIEVQSSKGEGSIFTLLLPVGTGGDYPGEFTENAGY